MEIYFPVHPFIWNYDDMYLGINFESKTMNSDELTEYGDPHLHNLRETFFEYQVVKFEQKISRQDANNINIHTWYLASKKIFESDDKTIKITTDSKIKFKDSVFGFIYDPNDVFDKSIYQQDNRSKNHHKSNPQYPTNPIYILKTDVTKINTAMIPRLYIHTHNIKGIFRFSPKDNSKIKFKDSVINPVFYVVVNNLIIIMQITFI